jgi:hypothetical protein
MSLAEDDFKEGRRQAALLDARKAFVDDLDDVDDDFDYTDYGWGEDEDADYVGMATEAGDAETWT